MYILISIQIVIECFDVFETFIAIFYQAIHLQNSLVGNSIKPIRFIRRVKNVQKLIMNFM